VQDLRRPMVVKDFSRTQNDAPPTFSRSLDDAQPFSRHDGKKDKKSHCTSTASGRVDLVVHHGLPAPISQVYAPLC
jgi:hypothetical protein